MLNRLPGETERDSEPRDDDQSRKAEVDISYSNTISGEVFSQSLRVSEFLSAPTLLLSAPARHSVRGDVGSVPASHWSAGW